MKLFITSLIVLSLVPVASAGGVGASVNSWGYGDCETDSYAYNYNSANAGANANGVGSAYVGGGTTCWAYYNWFTGQTIRFREVGAVGVACVDATGMCAFAGAVWFSYDNYCNTFVYSPATNQALGCPAGAPPAVRALIP